MSANFNSSVIPKASFWAIVICACIFLSDCREPDDTRPNKPPLARAGEDKSAQVGEKLSLDASLSSDPDGDSLSYFWQEIDKPVNSEATVESQYSITAIFVPDTPGIYTIRLSVSDGVATDADSIRIIVAGGTPLADAGEDRLVDVNEQVLLDGSGSFDPEGDPLSFMWAVKSKPAGASSILIASNEEQTIFIPDKPGQYAITLVVSDGESSDSDEVIIATDAPRITSVDPESGQTGEEVTISGANLSDNIGDVSVTFNGAEADVVSANYGAVIATVPSGAGTGEVTLTTRGETAIGPVFTYIPTVTVSTLAGDGTAGFLDGNTSEARFNQPADLVVGPEGNIFVADLQNHAVRMVTPEGEVATYAGNGQNGYIDASGQQAQFNQPFGIDADSDGVIYVADFQNNVIRIIDNSMAVSTLMITGPNGPEPALFNFPADVVVDEINDKIFVCEVPVSQQGGNNRVMVVENSESNLLAGASQTGFSDGLGSNASFNYPVRAALDGNGNLLVSDALNHSLRIITSAGAVSTLTGTGSEGLVNGSLNNAEFNLPFGIALAGGQIVIGDAGNFGVRKIDANDMVTTLAGANGQGYIDGVADTAQFNVPYGVALDELGNIYVADVLNHVVRKITIE